MSNMDKYIIVHGEILHYHYDSCFDKFYRNCKGKKKKKKKKLIQIKKRKHKRISFPRMLNMCVDIMT